MNHHLPHGIANAVLLTEVMKYNAAEVPTRMGTFSQYQYPHALADYAELGRFAGCKGSTDQEVFDDFIAKLEELKEKIGIKKSIQEYGIDEKYFLDTLDESGVDCFLRIFAQDVLNGSMTVRSLDPWRAAITD